MNERKKKLKKNFDLNKIFEKEIKQLENLYAIGAEKHTPEGWKLEEIPLHLAHLKEHIKSYDKGQETDEETGLNQFVHVTLRALFIIWLNNKEGKKFEETSLEDTLMQLETIPGTKFVNKKQEKQEPQDELKERVKKFRNLELPGQRAGMKIEINRLVDDLWLEILKLRLERYMLERGKGRE